MAQSTIKNHSVRDRYIRRKEEFSRLSAEQKRTGSLISHLRTFVFLIGAGGGGYLLYRGQYRLGGIVLVTGVLLFFHLIIKHEELKQKLRRTELLISLNETGLARLDGRWNEFADMGEEYIDPDHPFSNDLDLFGKASLFQWINATTTYFGRQHLRGILTGQPDEPELICARQEAIAELAEKIDWRQRLQAEGLYITGGKNDPIRLLRWAEAAAEGVIPAWQIPLLYILPVTAVAALLSYILIPGLHWLVPIAPLGIQLLFHQTHKTKMDALFKTFLKYKQTIRIYHGLLEMVESEKYASPYLQQLQTRLTDAAGRRASREIRRLGKLFDLIDIRYVPLYQVICNALVLWELHCVRALERWKADSGPAFRHWLMALGEAEALSSLAIIRHDQPDWAVPAFAAGPQTFAAKDIGHPLLPAHQRVSNDLALGGQEQILLITGSNMSGKSTLLRTVGINLVLAYAGAPVCAKELRCSRMEIYSSMRISDNLEKSISSFYAELLRVKMIIEAAGKRKQMLFLLDEIFRGTNSRDRHIGARTVMERLSREGAMGLVSTHDLELGDLAEKRELRIRNYHFREGYEAGRISFDYRLHPGISTTSNAIYLMKLVGIDMES